MDQLPPEIIRIISSSLEPEDIEQMSLTNSFLNTVMFANQKDIWLALNIREKYGSLDELQRLTIEDLKYIYFLSRDGILESLITLGERAGSKYPNPDYSQFIRNTGFVRYASQSLRDEPDITAMEMCRAFQDQHPHAMSSREHSQVILNIRRGIEMKIMKKTIMTPEGRPLDLKKYLKQRPAYYLHIPLRAMYSVCSMPYLVMTDLQRYNLYRIIDRAREEVDFDETSTSFDFYNTAIQYFIENEKSDFYPAPFDDDDDDDHNIDDDVNYDYEFYHNFML